MSHTQGQPSLPENHGFKNTLCLWIVSISCLILLASATNICASDSANNDKQTIKIGVLAKRGEARALQQWGPTANYLNSMIPNLHFEIVPLAFDAIYPATASREIDFILTNSALYVGLVYHHKIKRILTLKTNGWIRRQVNLEE